MLDRAPITAPRRVEVFAVGVDDAQIAWRSIGTGPVSVERDGVIVTKGATAELGVVVVDDLDPGSRHRFVV
ncbi:MAG: hypothetical protein OEU32_14985, partial [Acidimicrobiia bacterium]|nr:hypothetical protein [Acidimicrobiia bacterium]